MDSMGVDFVDLVDKTRLLIRESLQDDAPPKKGDDPYHLFKIKRENE